ncbi:MAG: alpha/beta fold hydrolase [Pseudanabaena sp.]|jgi:pimeloyl-ACP methyl ester carboxylesterase|uniref:alpha/beta fold hydrolase n=1 Tax=Pseudanabaena mucicola TaxID=71190 RepID=UPI00257857B0|nr:alpha/beta fold hydrolase [Pseudanabaena mucicola]MCA6573162.1 alpha/beta fold hydrolase [Pseudanabaena sp. M53BS1SP1A06MG]MCA6584441.1 alpha/beta fold hydrolase [Pseudanabaena sp. M34BS1SP1A06MG]MCA6586322.1 alpha/beta fold hydrolase [Pseudanabaena sp. M051S1SP1A06QC]MCA6590382.1 alpha/beta fold hydrolase [Pseudanabaena sp. M109S1SP1A06QC]MCA6591918.1 alpha/beta fold hydrolase [Pseudanabaena sp. M38BS1SP1A06MG]MCA6596028.1 alpha/beta fold hydrolase [Pseudanabaena sp. M046S1SP1A06QC]MCA66
MNRTIGLEYGDWDFKGWRSHYGVRQAQNADTNKPPILLIHGFGAAMDQWRDNIPALAAEHTVYTIDLLGFGASEKPPTDYSIYLWVEQVLNFWQKFVGTPMIIVGNSIGALVATIAASNHPEIAEGVVTISLPDIEAFQALVPKWLQPLERAVKAIVNAIFIKPLFYLFRQPWMIRFVLKAIVYCDRSRVDDQLVEIIAKPARDRQAAEAFARLNRSINQPNYSPSLTQALSKLQVPLLILWGSRDRIIPPSEGKRLVQYAANASLVYLENVGHCAHDDSPERVNHEILTWLA